MSSKPSKYGTGPAWVPGTLMRVSVHLYQNGVRLEEQEDKTYETSALSSSPPILANLVDLKPGPFQVYVEVPKDLDSTGNTLTFAIIINDDPILYQLCIPQTQTLAEKPYTQYITTITLTDTNYFAPINERRLLEASKDFKVVSVTARFAKVGGFEVKDKESGEVSIMYRCQHWMIEPPDTAIEVPTKEQDVPGGGIVYLEPMRIRVELLGEGLEFRFARKE